LFVRRHVVVVINARHFPSHTKIVRGDRCSNDTEKPRIGKIRVFSDLRDPIRCPADEEETPQAPAQDHTMPLLENADGFWLALGMMGTMAVVMALIFWRRRLLRG
jgi:hypothetical protein